ncbi:MAG: glycosyltransferase, partial [Muribaculaceae bacterium]|nr:glycosyltransferase [Muribaculaceae bacterium]
NQCDTEEITEFSFLNNRGEKCHATFISTKERGLSKSRNMAIKYAKGDICLICDDDELLENDYVEKLISGFQNHPEDSLIAARFKIPENYYMKKTFWDEPKRLTYKNSLKISSWQIAFKREDIIVNRITFDEMIGSGVSKAGGEEKIFLHDCLKKGLSGHYVPLLLGEISYNGSQWANNIFSYDYFIDWGYYTRRLKGGRLGATLLSVVFAFKKHKEYKDKCSITKALYGMLLGVYKKK